MALGRILVTRRFACPNQLVGFLLITYLLQSIYRLLFSEKPIGWPFLSVCCPLNIHEQLDDTGDWTMVLQHRHSTKLDHQLLFNGCRQEIDFAAGPRMPSAFRLSSLKPTSSILQKRDNWIYDLPTGTQLTINQRLLALFAGAIFRFLPPYWSYLLPQHACCRRSIRPPTMLLVRRSVCFIGYSCIGFYS